jgi:hypothetical protein
MTSLGFALSLCILGSTACSPSGAWSQHSVPRSSIDIAFPQAPSTRAQLIRDDCGVLAVTTMEVLWGAHGQYRLTYFAAPAACLTPGKTLWMLTVLAAAPGAAHWQDASSTPVTTDDGAHGTALLRRNSVTGASQLVHTYVLSHGVLSVLAERGAAESSDDTERFLGSVRTR